MELQLERELDMTVPPTGEVPGNNDPSQPTGSGGWRDRIIAILCIVVITVGTLVALQFRFQEDPNSWSAEEREQSLHFVHFSFAEDLDTTPSMDQVDIVRGKVEELFPDTSQWDLVRTLRLPLNIELSDDTKECSQDKEWQPCWGMDVIFFDQETDNWFGEPLGAEGGAFLVGLDPQEEGIRSVTFDAEVGYPSTPDRLNVALELDLKAAPKLSTSRMRGIEPNAILLVGSKGLTILQELADGLGDPSIADPFTNVNPDFYGEVAVRFKNPDLAGLFVQELRDSDWQYGFMTTHAEPEEDE